MRKRISLLVFKSLQELADGLLPMSSTQYEFFKYCYDDSRTLRVIYRDRDASSDDTIETIYVRNSRNLLQTELFIYS